MQWSDNSTTYKTQKSAECVCGGGTWRKKMDLTRHLSQDVYTYTITYLTPGVSHTRGGFWSLNAWTYKLAEKEKSSFKNACTCTCITQCPPVMLRNYASLTCCRVGLTISSRALSASLKVMVPPMARAVLERQGKRDTEVIAILTI